MHGKYKGIIKPFRSSHLILLALAFVLNLSQVPAAYAHKVYLFAWKEGDMVYTESYFSGSKKVKEGMIKVFDLSGKGLLKGKTDENGEFFFKAPQRTDLRIVLETSMGHRAEYILNVDEGDALGKETKPITETSFEPEAPSPPVIAADIERIKLLVEEVIDSRLEPISRRLTRMEKERGTGLTEVIGGIGYIFGIMGIILYLKARKKR